MINTTVLYVIIVIMVIIIIGLLLFIRKTLNEVALEIIKNSIIKKIIEREEALRKELNDVKKFNSRLLRRAELRAIEERENNEN